MAAELTGDVGTSQHFWPHADRTTDKLEGGQHLGAEREIGETRIREGIRVASGEDLFKADVMLDVRDTLCTKR